VRQTTLNSRVSITLIRGQKLSFLTTEESSKQLLEQFYDICSGELSDNCFEVETFDELNKKETLLIRASEISFIQVRKDYE